MEYVTAEALLFFCYYAPQYLVDYGTRNLACTFAMEGMSGIACCPGKAAPKRDPGHSLGSTLWQSVLPITYFIPTQGNTGKEIGNKKVILLKFS